MQQYNYGTPGSGQPGSLARTYTNTYLNSSTYTSRYILNRLATSTLTDGTHTTTLVSNSYDGNGYSNVPNITMHDSAYGTSFLMRGNLVISTSPSGALKSMTYDIRLAIVHRHHHQRRVHQRHTTSATTLPRHPRSPPSSLSSSMNLDPDSWASARPPAPTATRLSIGYTTSQRPTSFMSPTGAVTNTGMSTAPRNPKPPPRTATG